MKEGDGKVLTIWAWGVRTEMLRNETQHLEEAYQCQRLEASRLTPLPS